MHKIEKVLILACVSKPVCAFNDVIVLVLSLKCVIKLIMLLTVRHILNRENVVNVRQRQTTQSHQFSSVLDSKGLGLCWPLQQPLTICDYGAPEMLLVQKEGSVNVKKHPITKAQYALNINKACKIAHCIFYINYMLDKNILVKLGKIKYILKINSISCSVQMAQLVGA